MLDHTQRAYLLFTDENMLFKCADINKILEGLSFHTAEHFAYEEDYMRELGFDQLEEHIRCHEACLLYTSSVRHQVFILLQVIRHHINIIYGHHGGILRFLYHLPGFSRKFPEFRPGHGIGIRMMRQSPLDISFLFYTLIKGCLLYTSTGGGQKVQPQ